MHVAAAADPVVCDGQVEDQAPAARCIPVTGYRRKISVHAEVPLSGELRKFCCVWFVY
jgi:hypothetical protein